jgi:hypothetical protein
VTSASLTGRVEDPSGAIVCGIAVDVRNVDRNQTWSAVTDDDGRYRFPLLPVGNYELSVEAPGFAAARRQLALSVGQALDVPVHLRLAAERESLEVSSEVPVVETVRTQLAETILPREMDSLPLNGRNYLDLALLAPAVSRTNTGNNERFAETSAVPGTGLSITGQRNLHNGFLVDGVSANDDAADLAGTFYSQEVIREFQVVTSGAIAEFGRAAGGVINIVTHSGSNLWQARLYGFLRNQRLDARNAFATTEDPLTQAQYGATAGGPLRRDRTFLFTNLEQTRLNRAGFVTIAPANVAAINGALDRFGYRGPRVSTGEFGTGYDTTNYFARVDHRLNARHLLAARYSLYDVAGWNARGVGGLSDVSRGTRLDNRDQTFTISEIGTLSNRTVNELRFQFTRSALAAPGNDLVGPAINISGVANLGASTTSPTGRDTDLYQVVDNVSVQSGRHFLKSGADLIYNRVNILFPGALPGAYTFQNVASLQAGRYITYQQAFGEAGQFQSNPNLGWFVQDEWRPRPDLTLNLGLRYDLQWLPEPIRTDTNNVAPRVGLAWAPGDRKTVIRAGFGLFYDRIPLRAVSNALQRDGVKYKVAVVSFGEPAAPVFPGTLSGFPSGLLVAVTSIDPGIERAYSHQSSLQLERELGRQTSVSAGFTHVRGLHLILSRNINAPTLTPAQAAQLGVPNLGRPDPRFGNNSRYGSWGDFYYNGMTVALNRRSGRWGSVRLSYTLSKAIDTAGNFFFQQPQDANNIRDERGLGNNDQRHRLAVSGQIRPPRGWFDIGYIFSYNSALPFNIQTGNDRNNDTTVNDRPLGVGRNTGRGFNYASLDLRLSRRFRLKDRRNLEVMVESFNTLNRTNFQFPNATFGTGTTPLPAFGRPTAAADPRQIQFGLRLNL